MSGKLFFFLGFSDKDWYNIVLPVPFFSSLLLHVCIIPNADVSSILFPFASFPTHSCGQVVSDSFFSFRETPFFPWSRPSPSQPFWCPLICSWTVPWTSRITLPAVTLWSDPLISLSSGSVWAPYRQFWSDTWWRNSAPIYVFSFFLVFFPFVPSLVALRLSW